MIRDNQHRDQAPALADKAGGSLCGAAGRRSRRNNRVMVVQELVPVSLPVTCVVRQLKSIRKNGPDSSPKSGNQFHE